MLEETKKVSPFWVWARETAEQARARFLLNYWLLGGSDMAWFDHHIEALIRAAHPDFPKGPLFPEEKPLPFGRIRAA